MSTERPVRVAVINTSVETIELLREILADDGYTVVGSPDTTVTMFKRGQDDLRAFLTAADPQVIVWDIALPYEENWRYFETQRRAGLFAGRGVVLTTTNKRALDELVGPTPAHEIIGKPFDLNDLLAAVRAAVPAGE